MRWDCPHCKNALETADANVGAAWVFSLCPLCLRFGLIRQSAPAAIKVDRAPVGERFIRAGARITAPVVRPSAPRSTKIVASKTTPAPVARPVQTVPAAVSSDSQPHFAKFRIPEPLPEIPEKHVPLFPRLVLASCLAILAWNGYRYLRLNSNPVITDRLVAQAMAPIPEPREAADASGAVEPGKLIQSRDGQTRMYNGPGSQFPVIGALEPARKYAVISAYDGQWYQIQAGTQEPAWVLMTDVTPAN